MSKGILRLTVIDRMRLNYAYNTDYFFEIVITNPSTPRKMAKSAVYLVRFNPPSKNGTHLCPRPFFYRTITSVRNTTYFFNTINTTDNYDLKIGFENCDSLVN